MGGRNMPMGGIDVLRCAFRRREVMSEAEIMRIFIQIALALGYLHENRILHRCVSLCVDDRR